MAKRSKQARSGQAAMEFLMTYGWALLVVLVVIGALAYFGVLNPQSFLPKRCILGSGLSCVDSRLDTGGQFNMKFTNSLGNPIRVTNIILNDETLQNIIGTCAYGPIATPILPGENSPLITIEGCNNGVGGVEGLALGQRIKAKISIEYTDSATQFPHTQTGELIVDVEEPATLT